jgi:uncharacterized membrane protein
LLSKKSIRVLQILFNISIVLKGVDGLIELIGGVLFAILEKEVILKLIIDFLSYDLFKIPNKTVLELATTVSHDLDTSIRNFIIAVLIGNGFIKIAFAIGLLLRKMFIFPISIIFLIGLLIYQIIQTFYTPSLYLIFFNLFDFAVIVVIWLQYIHLKKSKKFR